MKLLKSITVILLLILSLIFQAQAATVHGTVFSWSDFERPLRNAIVEVNSTPLQSKVATDGTFSFDLSPGNYSIKAKYYRNNSLELINEENIVIDKEGNFTLDFLLFPPTDLENEFLVDLNLTNITERNDEPANPDYTVLYFTILLLVIFLMAGMYFLLRKKPGSYEGHRPEYDIIHAMDETGGHVETPSSPEDLSKGVSVTIPQPLNTSEEIKNKKLPDDLQQLYEAIMQSGGRVTQKDLRKKFTCSEAKVSLMLADLEDRGLIKKIKRGRANIIIAEPQK